MSCAHDLRRSKVESELIRDLYRESVLQAATTIDASQAEERPLRLELVRGIERGIIDTVELFDKSAIALTKRQIYAQVVPDEPDKAATVGAFQIVGDYGSKWALELMEANLVLRDIAARGPSLVSETGVSHFPPGTTLQIGESSVFHAVTQLTHHALPEFDDALELATVAANSGKVNFMAKTVPMGVLGPMDSQGIVFEHSLLVAAGSSVDWAPGVQDYLANEKRIYVDDLRRIQNGEKPLVPRNFAHVAGVGMGCPLAPDLKPLVVATIGWMQRRRQFLAQRQAVALT